ncbi:MAG: hypothetical protein ACI9JL_001154 [Paracoccaceae bacterium]|jgi:hypothetical protein
MDRAMRNYLIRRYALGPALTVSTHLAALGGIVFPILRRTVKHPVFIVGCSRSGTTLFAEIFGERPDACNVMDASQVWDLRYYDKSADDHRDENDATFWEVSRIRSSLAIRLLFSGHERLINKNNQNSLRLRYLKSAFPDALIIHVVRDARPVVLSNMSRVEKDRYRRGFPFGRFPKPVAWRSYMDKPVIEQFAHQWSDITAEIRKDGPAVFGPDQYAEVKFEEFCADPTACISRLDRFCGLPETDRAAAAIASIGSGDSDSWTTRLPATDIKRIDEITGEQMAVFGYSTGVAQ